MTIDRILQWCVYADYPIWRMQAQRYRDRVNKIILYPSKQHGKVDLEAFAKQVLPETWVERKPIDYGVEDWRQAETMPCLDQSDAEWVWFNEQDFFVKDWDKFWEDVEFAMKRAPMVGWWNETNFPYIHPSCLFIKRELLEKTKKDFRAHSEINGADHFSMITHQVQELGEKIITLQGLGYREWEDAFHLGGLTYVYQDWKGDGTDVFGVKNPEAFYVYNWWSQADLGIPFSLEYVRLAMEIESKMKIMFPDLNPQESHWREFFK